MIIEMEIYINCSSADINKFVHQHNGANDARQNWNASAMRFPYIFVLIYSSAKVTEALQFNVLYSNVKFSILPKVNRSQKYCCKEYSQFEIC